MMYNQFHHRFRPNRHFVASLYNMIGELTGALNKDYDKSHIIKLMCPWHISIVKVVWGLRILRIWVKMNREDQTLCQLSFTDKCYIKIDTFSIFYLLQNCLLDSVIYDFYLHLCTEIIVLRIIIFTTLKINFMINCFLFFFFFFSSN